MDVYERIYAPGEAEHAFVPAVIEGAVPDGLRGTLLRTGPGLQAVGPDPLGFFDGHALVAGLSFAPEGLAFRSRLVRTPLLAAERAAGRMTKRRVFTNLPSRWSNLAALDLGNPAMHDVVPWGGKIYACNDPGHFALDGATLETLGPERWGLPPGTEQSPMPYPDPATGRLVGWTKAPGGIRPDALAFVELDAAMAVVSRTPPLRLDTSPALVHDLRATERWYVATQIAGRLSPLRALWGAATVWDAFAWPERGGADLLLAPRPGGDRLIRIPLPGVSIAFHVINAHEDGDRLVVDLCTYDAPIAFSRAAGAALRRRVGVADDRPGPIPTPRRYVVDPAAGALLEDRVLGEGPLEAPEVPDDRMGRSYRYAYGATRVAGEGPDPGAYFAFDAVGKLDTATGLRAAWSAGPRAISSPPAFVRRGPDEDDGWLLTWVHTAEGTSVAVLDARDPAAGPVARVGLGALQLGGVSHVRFAPDLQLAR